MALVSIITASYNCEEYISDTYECIAAQTFSDWEWLVTDDCSTDKSLSLLNRICEKDPRVRVFPLEINSGAAVARNNSLSFVAGEFIAFIDSDDLWERNKLSEQLNFMGKTIDFSFTAYELVDSQGNTLDKFVDRNQSGSFSYNDMLMKKATLGCSTVILRRKIADGVSMPLLRTGQDYAFWLKILKRGTKAHVLNQPLTKYRILPNSISRNKFKKAKRQWEIYREVEKLGLFKSSYCFFFYAWRAIFRK